MKKLACIFDHKALVLVCFTNGKWANMLQEGRTSKGGWGTKSSLWTQWTPERKDYCCFMSVGLSSFFTTLMFVCSLPKLWTSSIDAACMLCAAMQIFRPHVIPMWFVLQKSKNIWNPGNILHFFLQRPKSINICSRHISLFRCASVTWWHLNQSKHLNSLWRVSGSSGRECARRLQRTSSWWTRAYQVSGILIKFFDNLMWTSIWSLIRLKVTSYRLWKPWG